MCSRVISPLLFLFLFFSTSLLLGIAGYPKFILYLSFLSPQIAHFSKSPQFFFSGSGIGDQLWGVSVFIVVEESASWPFQ